MLDKWNQVIRPKRKGLRLPDVDYSTEGYYFVTICIDNRKCILGEVVENVGAGSAQPAIFIPSKIGKIVEDTLVQLPYLLQVRNHIFQIMPNHLHLIIEITDRPLTVGAGSSRPQTVLREPKFLESESVLTLGKIMGYFKFETTRIYNDYLNCGRQDGAPTSDRIFETLWQRNYYERIIRDEKELAILKYYIEQNPNDWAEDEENPQRKHLKT